VVVTFMMWAVAFVLGLSLVVWPNLEDYRSKPGLSRPLGFIDAFYYSGVTVSVLGYGDITPTTGPLKVLAVAASGLGFAVLTGLVTYLVQVIQAPARLRLPVERSRARTRAGPARRVRGGRSVALGEGDPAVEMVTRSRTFLAAVADMLGVSSDDEVHAGALRS
jgi:hypothetical protein